MTSLDKQPWPRGFYVQMESLLSDDHAAFFQALSLPSPVSIRINPLKPVSLAEQSRPVPWCKGGWYLRERPKFILDPLWHAGCYYVQEPSSMIIDLVIRELNLTKSPLTTLDLCAAPGGKTTIINSALHPESFILANEVNKKRFSILKNNMTRWGYTNVFMSNEDPRIFSSLPPQFDLILVDAPCSGEGLFRKDPQSSMHWSQANIRVCSRRQSRILKDVLPALNPGGTLIYTTCTFNHEENIKVAQNLVDDVGLRSIEIPLIESHGFLPIKSQDTIGYQAYPHLLKGEGLFLAVFQKNESPKRDSLKNLRKTRQTNVPDYVNASLSSEIVPNLHASKTNDIFYLAPEHDATYHRLNDRMAVEPVKLGQLKKGFVPSHGLAMRAHLFSGSTIAINYDEALQYLYKQPVEELNDQVGWHLVTYKGYGLGWIKGVGRRYNNYYPNSLRIRRDIEKLRQASD